MNLPKKWLIIKKLLLKDNVYTTKFTNQVFPIIEKALLDIPSQTKTILEAFEKMVSVSNEEIKEKIRIYAAKYLFDPKNSVKKQANKILKK